MFFLLLENAIGISNQFVEFVQKTHFRLIRNTAAKHQLFISPS